MPRLNNLECSIHTDKGPIKEYPATATHFDNEDFPCKTVYIQPEAGKHFKIEFTAHYYVPPASDPKYDCLGIQISCDGHTEKYCSLTDSMWWRVSGRCRSPVVRSIAGYQTAPDVLKRYIFSPIQTTEERCKRAEGVGEICVFIIRVNMGDACEVNWPNSEPASVGNLFERDFKVLGCVTGYERARCESEQYYEGIKHLNSMRKPFAMFRFLYRTDNELKRLGVIERTRTPMSSPSPLSSAESDILDEERWLSKRLAQLQKARERRQTVKRGKGRGNSTERLAKRTKQKDKDVVYIDLAGESAGE